MDTAKSFKPKTILLWEKTAEHPEALRIIAMFPSAKILIIKNQRLPAGLNITASKALLKSKQTLMIGQTTSFIGRFDGKLGSNLHCCPYHKLVPLSNGCPYYCTYCYLAFVYRKYSPFIKININYETMFKQIRKASSQTKTRIHFNMGEMLDSLALDHISNLTTILVPFFSGFSKAYLMLLTKSCNIDNLLTVEPNNHVVVSWSLNPREIISRYEPGTSSLTDRIKAASKCQQHGYRIRFRIDPGILYKNWKRGYADLIQKALTATSPENITLGMLRLMPGHFKLIQKAYPNKAATLLNHKFVKGASDHKLRYSQEQRIEFYSFLIDTIRSFDKNISISLCRETSEIWHNFNNLCQFEKCNCVTW
jgi:spore photoproduct lyase